jgi:hypothetical protein
MAGQLAGDVQHGVEKQLRSLPHGDGCVRGLLGGYHHKQESFVDVSPSTVAR